jgi:uncharacterized protein YebE (UPF0316 family)
MITQTAGWQARLPRRSFLMLQSPPMLPENVFLAFLLIFILRIIDVGLGTIRTVFILQGRKEVAALIGFVEVTVFIFAISQAIAGIGHSWVLMLAYSGGFASGTYLGLLIEAKFAMGFAQVRIISQSRGEDIIQALWEANHGATLVEGNGRQGPVDMVFSIVPRRAIQHCVTLASAIDPDCFVSVSDSRYLFRGYMGHLDKRK